MTSELPQGQIIRQAFENALDALGESGRRALIEDWHCLLVWSFPDWWLTWQNDQPVSIYA